MGKMLRDYEVCLVHVDFERCDSCGECVKEEKCTGCGA
jgi:hypothetical protein